MIELKRFSACLSPQGVWWRLEGGVMIQNSGTSGALALVGRFQLLEKGKVVPMLFN